MFKQPFSFDGRIRRMEYGLSILSVSFASTIISSIAVESQTTFILFAYIPILWFCWAQGAKRCHDLGNSGFYQIIPFYSLWMLFQDGERFPNEYGDNPKGLNLSNVPPSSAYQPSNGYDSGYNAAHDVTVNHTNQANNDGYNSSYDGGHNAPQTQTLLSKGMVKNESSDVNESDYKNGNLYN